MIVPKPHPGVFRITKNIHNTLQGVSPDSAYISADEKNEIVEWISDNGNRYWFSDGGPLCRPDKGGADIIIVSPISTSNRLLAWLNQSLYQMLCIMY